MNKSEIAELIAEVRKFKNGFMSAAVLEEKLVEVERERAIAESQAPQPKCLRCNGVRRVKKPDGLGSMTCPECRLGDGEPSAPPDKFKTAWAEYSKGGHGALGWEKIAFTHGFGEGFKAGRESGAAQEVSPLPVITISHGAPPGIGPGPSATGTSSDPRTGYLKQEEVSPPSPSAETLTHSRSCQYWDSEGGCTCSLDVRIALQTEQTMHNAWRKRAEEAEGDTRELKAALPEFIANVRKYKNGWLSAAVLEEKIAPIERLLG